jgi:hypothetical protein
MIYKAKAAVSSEIRTNIQRKASNIWNFLMLSLVVREENTRL